MILRFNTYRQGRRRLQWSHRQIPWDKGSKTVCWKCSTLKAIVAILKFNLWQTGSQCRSARTASVFWTSCRRAKEKSCKKVFDLDFQGHVIKIDFFHYRCCIPWPRKHTHEKYFQKIRTGRQKSRRVVPTPLGRFWLTKYLGWLRNNNYNELLYVKRALILEAPRWINWSKDVF